MPQRISPASSHHVMQRIMGSVPLALRGMILHPKGKTYWDTWRYLSTAIQDGAVSVAVIQENSQRVYARETTFCYRPLGLSLIPAVGPVSHSVFMVLTGSFV